MTAHSLDWSHAFSYRLQGTSPESSVFAARLGAVAASFAGMVAAGELPYLNLPFRAALEAALPPVLEGIKDCRHLVVLGIGGSALGARALQKAFYPAQDRPNHAGRCLWIADNVDADTLTAWMSLLPPEETAVAVVSKSGGTIETAAQYFLLRDWLRRALGEGWKRRVIMVTDEAKGDLRAEAVLHGLASLPVPDNLGGRYSVLSAVGMLPAAFLGMDWKGLLRGAAAFAEPLATAAGKPEDMQKALAQNPAWHLALWCRELMERGYSELIFFSYIPLWGSFGDWFCQLWAESLGKEGKGSLPVAAVGVTDQHSVNQMFLDGPRNKGCLFLTCGTLDKGPAFENDLPEKWKWLAGKRFGGLLAAEGVGTRMALAQSGVPLVHADMAEASEEAAGRLMQLCMTATVLTGMLMDINPLDQPAVELGKRLACACLGAPGYAAEHAELEAFLASSGARVQVF